MENVAGSKSCVAAPRGYFKGRRLGTDSTRKAIDWALAIFELTRVVINMFGMAQGALVFFIITIIAVPFCGWREASMSGAAAFAIRSTILMVAIYLSRGG